MNKKKSVSLQINYIGISDAARGQDYEHNNYISKTYARD